MQSQQPPLSAAPSLPPERGPLTAAGSLVAGPSQRQRQIAAPGPLLEPVGGAAAGSVRQALQGPLVPSGLQRPPGSAGSCRSGRWSSSSGGEGGGGGGSLAARPGTTSSTSSASSSSHGTPAGAAVAAVRAAAARSSGSLAAAAVTATTASAAGGNAAGAGAVNSSRQSQRYRSPARGGGGEGAGGGGGGGGGSQSRVDGGGARAPVAAATATGADGGGGGDVSGLPLEQQVAHYARAGAAAAAGADAVKAAMAFHLLNGCFLRATGGYEGATALAAAAAAAAPGLPAALVEAVSEGAPQSLVAYNTLSYLALAAEVVPRLLSCGLVAVLAGQLRAAATAPLEQQLLVSGLGLMVTLTRVSADARGRLAAMRGVATALTAALGHPAAAIRAPALQLVQELVLTRKGLVQLRSSQALQAALDRLCDEPPGAEDQQAVGGGGGGAPEGATRESQQKLQAQLQRQARLARGTIRALAAVMK